MRNQPSAVVSACANPGRCQYPAKTVVPRTCTPPTTSAGRASPGCSGTSSSSARRTSTPGSGRPTVPARHGPPSGFVVRIEVSVMP